MCFEPNCRSFDFFLIDTSEEYRNAIKDKSTIIEYSNNGKGTYRVHVTSDSLAQPKTKMFRVGTAYQRLVGSTENKNDHTLVMGLKFETLLLKF